MKSANAITNVFGAVAGVPQIILGITLVGNNEYAEGAAKIAEGIGLFIVAFFVGKKIE